MLWATLQTTTNKNNNVKQKQQNEQQNMKTPKYKAKCARGRSEPQTQNESGASRGLRPVKKNNPSLKRRNTSQGKRNKNIKHPSTAKTNKHSKQQIRTTT